MESDGLCGGESAFKSRSTWLRQPRHGAIRSVLDGAGLRLLPEPLHREWGGPTTAVRRRKSAKNGQISSVHQEGVLIG